MLHRFLLVCCLSGLTGLLTGCETRMGEAACNTANWAEIGHNDGLAGHQQRKFEDRAAQCARFDISADRDRYRKGWQQALDIYCTTENGLRIGTNDGRYQGICPPGREREFLTGYNRGRAYAGARKSFSSAERRYDALIYERDRLSRQLDRLYDALEKTGTATTDRRDVTRQEIDQLRERIRDIDSYELEEARRERDAARRALDTIERAYEQFSRSLKSDQLTPFR